MKTHFRKILEDAPVEASAPCRLDAGGTVDLPTFSLPLQSRQPSTVNIALNLRTHVFLKPFDAGMLKVSSRGFKSVVVSPEKAPFRHPLGLIFAVAAHFNARGVHIHIDSASPPQSALGGSSVAAVALIKAFFKLLSPDATADASRRRIALLAHAIEAGVAGVPCGLQDQLAAVFGGVNAWYWKAGDKKAPFRRVALAARKDFTPMERHLLLCYCGKPHASKDINGRWVEQFLAGKHRAVWTAILSNTHRLEAALAQKDYTACAQALSEETELRLKLTPDVLDVTGKRLFRAAKAQGCGARFTGAGGGGCVWAIGEADRIVALRERWAAILSRAKGARFLPATIDAKGVL
jgi:D-glycero-alpha-D-manno-heptose-7-phosphate kinase